MARPTIKHVAEAAKVSFKTVSRVVNNESGVSDELAARVRAAIAELGYQPDERARHLRRRDVSAATIGVIHADIGNPFFTAIHRGLEEVATQKDCLILTGSSDEQGFRQEALVSAFACRRVDGLVVVPVDTPSESAKERTALTSEIDRGTPVVFVDRESGMVGDLVMSDHRGGAYAATRHLINGGHQRIACLATLHYQYSARERCRGFQDAMQESGLDPNLIFVDLLDQVAAAEVVTELLSRPANLRPTALFAAQNHLAAGSVKALHALGLQHDVALVGFDELEMGGLVEPGVTVIPQNATALGRWAGKLLFEQLEGVRRDTRRVVLPMELITRGSGEIPAPMPAP